MSGVLRKSGSIVCAIAFVTMLLMPIALAQNPNMTLRKSSCIEILDDSGFTKRNSRVSSGTGTSEDPYVIQDLRIDAKNRDGILIMNTASHFVVRNVAIAGADVPPYAAIHLVNVTNGDIESVTLTGNWIGVYVQVSTAITLEGSSISSSGLYGVDIADSTDVSILGTSISNSADTGIHLFRVTNLTVADCRIGYCLGTGIFSVGTLYATITRNLINSNWLGINLAKQYYMGNGGVNVYGNVFLNNTASETGLNTNLWDAGYPAGGNFWSSYRGTDLYSGPLQDQPGSDGIGDTPFILSYGPAQDRYPLMSLPRL